ncbi:hypothetical protein GCM10027291_14850 [Telluribacter humicola]
MERTDKVSGNDKAVIYLTLKHGSKIARRSLQIYCKKGALDAKTRTVKGDSKATSIIQLACIKAESFVADFRLTERELDPFLIMSLILKECDLKDDTPTFYEVLEKELERYQDLEDVEYTRKTVNKMENSVKHIGTFLQHRFGTKQVAFSKINHATAKDFIHYMRTQMGFCSDTVRKLHGLCKRTYAFAIANNWCEYNPFLSISIKHTRKEVLFLNDAEIKRLQQAQFLNDTYRETRDLVLFQCLTGLSYADLYILSPTQIITNENGLKYIFARRYKTHNDFATLLIDTTLQILERYKNHPVCIARGTCLPVPTNQQYNRVIKEIAKIIGINKRLTSHVFRKTFATLMVNKGLSKESLQYAMAHSSIGITEKHYLNQQAERTIREQAKIFQLITTTS